MKPCVDHDLIRATSPGVEPVVALCRACGKRFMRRDGEWVCIEDDSAAGEAMTTWSNVSCTIGGVPFPIEDVTVEGVVTETTQRVTHGVYTAECSVILKGEDARSIFHMFMPRIRGATDATLAKRVGYGGRKGRSALRRLLAKGFVGVLHINDFAPMPLPPFRITTRATLDCGEERPVKCFFCGGSAHPATGHAYSETCIACGPCYRDFLRFFRGRLANPIARASQGNYGPHEKRKKRTR